MALVRWEPVRELDSIQSEMNRLFNTFFDTPTTAGNAAPVRRWMPAMDLVEHEDHFLLTADLPGMKQEDVKLEVSDGVLTIAGERKTTHEERKGGYIRIERAAGTFQRSLTLPEGVDPEQVGASFRDGVLEVRIPKPVERKPHRVQIAVNGGQAAIEGEASDAAGQPESQQQ
ncbi:MAG: UDP-glucose 4-epimerase [uncultured Solirubrobacteraceae bacterium]|uniref:UDP-glucose 4-epimerase n=1 Tax=uncultured Solirubrobacteraceae bacterium TaxID=1162706 RepID=A0A6J4TPP9_9ACTN|nr:MAG: UDP-glucose 4-epimerase [uncultured Solirubrobacteraceae bacterium]